MRSDLCSSSGTSVKIECSAYWILTIQSCLCRFYTCTWHTACQCTCQCSAGCRCKLSALIYNIVDAVWEGTACHTVQNNCSNCYFSFTALISCFAVNDRCQQIQIICICSCDRLFCLRRIRCIRNISCLRPAAGVSVSGCVYPVSFPVFPVICSSV